MQTRPEVAKTIDEYIAGFPADVQAVLEKVRRTIRDAAPGAREAMKYGIPTFTLEGNLVHFGAFQRHVGFYPTPSGIEAFRARLAGYEGARGTVRFPYDKPIPYDLIGEIVRFRVRENLEAAQGKGKTSP